MGIIDLSSFAQGRWVAPSSNAREIASAVTGEIVARGDSAALDFSAMVAHARSKGGAALRAMTFTQRAAMLKALAQYLNERRQPLYDLAFKTGATMRDNRVDIDGGISTMFVYASKGRRELPDSRILREGDAEVLARDGSFLGQHVLTPLQGVAVHINAFNFPVWGMLEKLAPCLLAGVPAIVKPATSTSYVTQACFRMIIESGLLPDGAVQLVIGVTGNLLDLLDGQDIVSFTGSAQTATKLALNPLFAQNATRFIAERDSLNAALLGQDAEPGTPEFDLFVEAVVTEMTVKAGQKCTAIRRALVPRQHRDAVIDALRTKLSKVRIGDPADKATDMGALVSLEQREDVLAKVEELKQSAELVFGGESQFEVYGADAKSGAFVSPMLLSCDKPLNASPVHEVEAFGPVATVMAYDDLDQACALLNAGQGSLVASVYSHDVHLAEQVVLETGSFHGRLLFVDRDNADTQTGHGSPLPHLVHGGPGRAGGGEEMGGLRGVMHYMQRTAIQAGPRVMQAVAGSWVRGADETTNDVHPFRLAFDELEIGKTLHTQSRQISLADIEKFAEFTGDNFYAHMDEDAAKANPFFPGRVAHGYLLLSFAAGLFVDPDPGPVLANYGLDNLRFVKPVSPGDSIKVRLTAKEKALRNPAYGEVRWDVEVTNQNDEPVAQYELLTMNALSAQKKET